MPKALITRGLVSPAHENVQPAGPLLARAVFGRKDCGGSVLGVLSAATAPLNCKRALIPRNAMNDPTPSYEEKNRRSL